MLINQRNLRLAEYLSSHYGERKDARGIYRDLVNQFGDQLGFGSEREIKNILKVYCNKTIRRDGESLEFEI